MKQKIYSIAILLLWGFYSFSQAPGWAWAESSGGSGNDAGYAVTSDPSGNIVAAGSFTGSAAGFGGTQLTSAGQSDIFIVKYDKSGNIIWAKSAGGDGIDYGYSITTDASGNIYVTGSFGGSGATFDTYTINNKGGWDVFIAKYDTAGNCLWVKSAAGTGDDHGWSIACDDENNPYITGKFISPDIDFGNGAMINAGNWDIFIAKYNPSGNLLWAERFGGSNWDNVNSVVYDNSGRMYICGYFESSTIVLGPDTLIETDSSGFFGDAFVARMDKQGNILWAENAGGSDWDESSDVVADSSGNAYICGYFKSGTIDFNGIVLNNTSGGFNDVFVAKYDSTGNVIWAKKAGGNGDDYANAIDLMKNGGLCLSGACNSINAGFDTFNINNNGLFDVFVVGYNTSGNVQWVKNVGGSGIEGCYTICTGNQDNIYITAGFFSDSLVFGNYNIFNAGANNSSDIFTACLGANNGSGFVQLQEKNNCIKVFPNPANDRFFVAVPDDASQITVFNYSGQIVKSLFTQNENIFAFEPAENGIYFIQVKTSEKILSEKLVMCK